jgi:hypothetical protein
MFNPDATNFHWIPNHTLLIYIGIQPMLICRICGWQKLQLLYMYQKKKKEWTKQNYFLWHLYTGIKTQEKKFKKQIPVNK